MLSSLPVELLDLIVRELRVRDLKRLRQTCRILNIIASPLVFSRLVLDFNSGRYGLIMSLLEAIASNKSRLGPCIRSLEIQSFNPPQTNSFKLWQRLTKKHEHVRSIVEEQFIAAIPHFVSVKSLSLNLTNMQHLELPSEDRIMEGLASLPRLSHLSIYMNHDVDPRIPPAISRHFRNLQSLHFSGGRVGYGDMAGWVIANSPRLANLIVDGSAQHDGYMSLVQLTSKLPPNVQLPLRTLTLGGFSQHRYNSILSISHHLRVLKTLIVHSDLTDIPAHFWHALKSSNVRLERMSVHQADQPLLNYLESYSGLTHLSIDLCGFRHNDRRDEDSMADVFYGRVLPKHVDSLTTLHVKIPYEGRWSLGGSQVNAILGCYALSTLSVGIGPSETDVTEKNIMSRFIKSILHGRLPHLKALKLFLAYPTSARGIGDSVLLMYSTHGICGHMRLNELVSACGCNSPGRAMTKIEVSTGHIHHGPPSLSVFRLEKNVMDGKYHLTIQASKSKSLPSVITYNDR